LRHQQTRAVRAAAQQQQQQQPIAAAPQQQQQPGAAAAAPQQQSDDPAEQGQQQHTSSWYKSHFDLNLYHYLPWWLQPAPIIVSGLVFFAAALVRPAGRLGISSRPPAACTRARWRTKNTRCSFATQ
jgi:hypothetical protein